MYLSFDSWKKPTPVSALIHAATLVTAGLYLLVRSSPLLEYSSTALLVITLIGASTAFFAATCGLVQNDLKRIIAFSTISQLGYIFLLHLMVYLFTYDWLISILSFYFYIDIYVFLPNVNILIKLVNPKQKKLFVRIAKYSFKAFFFCGVGTDFPLPTCGGLVAGTMGDEIYNFFPDIENLIEENDPEKERINRILVDHFYSLCANTSPILPQIHDAINFGLVPYSETAICDLTQSTFPFTYRSPSAHFIEQLGPFETQAYSLPVDAVELNEQLMQLKQSRLMKYINKIFQYLRF